MFLFVVTSNIFGCKSLTYSEKTKTISLIGPEITTYESTQTEYIDSTIFCLKGSILSKDSLQIKKRFWIYGNKPLTRVERIGTLKGYDYEYFRATSTFSMETDEMGQFSCYFTSDKKFILSIAHGHIEVKPIMGKELNITIYDNK